MDEAVKDREDYKHSRIFRLYANTDPECEVNARRANATRSAAIGTRCCADLDRGLTGAGRCHADRRRD